jgi:hypothetical protein
VSPVAPPFLVVCANDHLHHFRSSSPISVSSILAFQDGKLAMRRQISWDFFKKKIAKESHRAMKPNRFVSYRSLLFIQPSKVRRLARVTCQVAYGVHGTSCSHFCWCAQQVGQLAQAELNWSRRQFSTAMADRWLVTVSSPLVCYRPYCLDTQIYMNEYWICSVQL